MVIEDRQPPALAHRGPILAGLMLTMALAAMDGTIVATAIPTIVRDLGGFALFPWVFSSYLLAQAASIPVYGKLADLYGRKPILLLGSGIFLLGSALSGLSWGMVPLIVFRGVQGLGAGAIISITTTVVGDIYTVQERAKIQGLLSSVWGIAAIVGPAAGGLLVQYVSWHWIFYINLPIGMGALTVIGLYLHEAVAKRAHRIDYWGSVLLTIGMVLMILGLLEGGVGWAWNSVPAAAVLGLGGILLVGFVAAESRAAEPVLPLWVFRHRMLSTANIGSLVVGLLTIGLSSFLPTFVQGVQGATPLVAGFALAVMSLGWPLASGLSGQLYMRVGFQRTALLGGFLTAASSMLLVHLGQASGPVQAAFASFVMGLGLGLMSTALIVAVQSAVGWNRRGVVTGANMFMRMLGSALGAAIFGSLLNGTLSQRLKTASPRVQAHLPPGLNAASLAMGASVPRGIGAFLRHALYSGVHVVFVAVLVSAIMGITVLLIMPQEMIEVPE